MKNFRIKTAATTLLLTLFAVSVSAQPQQRPQQRPHRGGQRPSAEKVAEISTDKLDQRLDLTDSQESKIYAINLKYAQQRETKKEEIKANKNESKEEVRPDRAAMKKRMEANQVARKEHMTEIMATLTDEQKVDYAMMLGKAKQKGGKKHNTHKPQGTRATKQRKAKNCK